MELALRYSPAHECTGRIHTAFDLECECECEQHERSLPALELAHAGERRLHALQAAPRGLPQGATFPS